MAAEDKKRYDKEKAKFAKKAGKKSQKASTPVTVGKKRPAKAGRKPTKRAKKIPVVEEKEVRLEGGIESDEEDLPEPSEEVPQLEAETKEKPDEVEPPVEAKDAEM